MNEKIIIFYKYVQLEYPKRIMKWQKKICQDLNLKGRILLAHEGINGTVGGSVENIERYKSIMQKNPLFADIDFKESSGDADCFVRMQVTIRNEVVHLGLDPNAVTTENNGEHLTPDQTHALLANKSDDVVLLDARNDYEWRIGHFKDAIKPPIKNFREFPEYVDNNIEQFKDKQVVMYCTAGVRCERASTYLKSKGIAKKVYQMHGGIHRYVEKYPDGFFRGKNYVFDRRLAIKVNDDIVGSCSMCNAPCDDYTNCLNAMCNKHYIACTNCTQKLNGTCSEQCKELVARKEVKTRTPFKRVEVTS